MDAGLDPVNTRMNLETPSYDAQEAKTPDPGTAGMPTFAQFAEVYCRELGVGWRRNTRDWMRSLLSVHALPGLGRFPLNTIGRTELLAFRAALAESKGPDGRRLSNTTINVVMRIIRSVLVEGGQRFGYPDSGAGIKRLRPERPEIHPFSLEEVQKILNGADAYYRPYLTVRFFTGMRPGEAHGLKWKHVDFATGLILIRETWLRGRCEATKTDGSRRDIHMNTPVRTALETLRPSDAKATDYVFKTKGGTAFHNENFTRRVWSPLLVRLGLEPRRPYQMRHTCATLWLASGENAEWVARQLGHADTEMLFRIYSRFIPNLTRRDGSAFEKLLADTMPGSAERDDTGEGDTAGMAETGRSRGRLGS
jgi:integrase